MRGRERRGRRGEEVDEGRERTTLRTPCPGYATGVYLMCIKSAEMQCC